MSLLNLRGEDSVPEPDNEVVLPETPPGLEAIRAWIGKPRPWLRGIQLWIEHIRDGRSGDLEAVPRTRASGRQVAAESAAPNRSGDAALWSSSARSSANSAK